MMVMVNYTHHVQLKDFRMDMLLTSFKGSERQPPGLLRMTALMGKTVSEMVAAGLGPSSLAASRGRVVWKT